MLKTFEIPDPVTLKLNAFGLKQPDLSVYGASRCFSVKSTDPTGCGNHPVSWHFRRIWVLSHRLTHTAVCLATKRMSEIPVSGYSTLRHSSQQIIDPVRECLHGAITFPANACPIASQDRG